MAVLHIIYNTCVDRCILWASIFQLYVRMSDYGGNSSQVGPVVVVGLTPTSFSSTTFKLPTTLSWSDRIDIRKSCQSVSIQNLHHSVLMLVVLSKPVTWLRSDYPGVWWHLLNSGKHLKWPYLLDVLTGVTADLGRTVRLPTPSRGLSTKTPEKSFRA